jgi:hypothetical protein
MFIIIINVLSTDDDDVDLGLSSDEDVSDNEFSSNNSSGGVQTKKRGFSFDFDDGEVTKMS